MAQGDIDLPSVPDAPGPARKRPIWVRLVAFLAILGLVGFISQTGHALWTEWSSLQQDHERARDTAVIGYLNINPNPSYARLPADWSHEEGDEGLLWSGWRDGENHWFRYARGDLDGLSFSSPIGQDVIQAIDYPIFEQGSGPRWDRVPDEAPVVGLEGKSGGTSYPMRVLDKVEVVNDRTGDRPVLIAYSPVDQLVTVFDANLEGQVVTMGHSGYFLDRRPVLYDRGTESLWVEQGGKLTALAGRRKGSSLKPIGKVRAVAWSDWRAKHPGSRLLIGADRSRAKPLN